MIFIDQLREDARQDAAIKAWERGIDNPRWIARVAKNAYLDARKHRAYALSSPLVGDIYPAPPDNPEARENLDAVVDQIGQDGVDFILHAFVFGYDRTAKVYNIPAGTVRSRVSMLRAKVRSLDD